LTKDYRGYARNRRVVLNVGLFAIRILRVMPVITIQESLGEDLAQVLQAHWLFCTSSTPIEHVYALDASKLFAPDITVFGASINGEIVGVGALRKLDAEHAELKSMHTLAKSRGLGIGKAMVLHIESFAKNQGFKRISLETGANEPFKPARQLYTSLGYQECEAFGDYVLTEDNTCMTKLI
jgi:putative acetyltransferase